MTTSNDQFHRLPAEISAVQAFDLTSKFIESTLQNTPSVIKDMTVYLSKSKGKNIRTRLLIGCAVKENEKVNKDAVLFASAIEILHLATLVHDDIMDNAGLRRGIPALHTEFGNKSAVITGDYLLTLAISSLAPLLQKYSREDNSGHADIAAQFYSSLPNICLGELRQHANSKNADISFFEYLRIISGKTAALFKLSAALGAFCADLPKKEIIVLSNFGSRLGLMFQIIDDCKDYVLDEEKSLKTIKNDILSGVITLPLIFSIQSDPLLKASVSDCMATGSLNARIINQVKQSGMDKALRTAGKLSDKCRRLISPLESENNFKYTYLTNILQSALDALQ